MGYLPDRLVSLRPEKRQPLISGHKLPPLPSVAMDQDCKSTTSLDITILTLSSVVFQWSISYMISPDAANLGLKAIYIWAGLLVPTTVLLYLYYPEVCPDCTVRILLTCRRTVDHIKSSTSSMSERYQHGDSKTRGPNQTSPATRTVPSNIMVIDRRLEKSHLGCSCSLLPAFRI
jgi:hypothetical protein